MENKVLVKVIFPELEKCFDVFIPVNELAWKIIRLMSKSISDLCDIKLIVNNYMLINAENGTIYNNNDILINTDIRNGTELILISKSIIV